jgi:hypothetical protein
MQKLPDARLWTDKPSAIDQFTQAGWFLGTLIFSVFSVAFFLFNCHMLLFRCKAAVKMPNLQRFHDAGT